MTDLFAKPDTPDGRTWWHCTECSVGWWGHLGSCWCCGQVITIARGPALLGEPAPKAERPYLSPHAVSLVQAQADPIEADHRPFWAFWRRAA